MDVILGLTNRKKRYLTEADIADGIISIGDAAFSFCESLRQVCIPASVEFLGVAAFCGSGLETVVFEGVPKAIEKDVFRGCQHLKRIVVPKGCRAQFIAKLGVAETLVVEGDESTAIQDVKKATGTQRAENVNLFGDRIVKRTQFHYNQQSFNWAVGDKVNLNTFFSGPTTIMGDPAYLFRKKALFIFLKSTKAFALSQERQYEIPANVRRFLYKYKDIYDLRFPRVFVFVCDDGRTATVYDEVEYLKANSNCIVVKSLLRYENGRSTKNA